MPTYDQLGGIISPPQPSATAGILKQVVDNDTPLPDYPGLAIARDWPVKGQTTWYFPSTTAIIQGKATAAMDTVIATGDQVGAAIEKISDVGATVINNLWPLLIGGAIFWAWIKAQK